MATVASPSPSTPTATTTPTPTATTTTTATSHNQLVILRQSFLLSRNRVVPGCRIHDGATTYHHFSCAEWLHF